MVQLRHIESHQNLPGIESGDIGPTMGIVPVEEGWCRFNRVRLPKEALLCRYQSVADDGTYTSPPKKLSKRGYSTMMFVRAAMCHISYLSLSKAATITTRYTLVRHQFRKPGETRAVHEGGLEMSVLDYQGVQYRVLPSIACAYAMKFTAKGALRMQQEMEKRVLHNSDVGMVSEVHAIGSCLKVVTTTFAVDGIEELRRACGGMGFSCYSGLDHLYGNAMVNFTGEGENYMLIQQTTRWLLKAMLAAQASAHSSSSAEPGLSSPYIAFLFRADELAGPSPKWAVLDWCQNDPSLTFLDSAWQLHAFEYRAAQMVAGTLRSIQENIEEAEGVSSDRTTAAVNSGHLGEAQWEGIQAAIAFGHLLVVQNFIHAVQSAPSSLRPALKVLKDLFSLNLIKTHMSDFVMAGCLSHKRQCADALKKEVNSLLTQVRHDAIAYVEAFGYRDSELNSALGRADGAVYETLLNWARKDPMNRGKVMDGWTDTWGKLTRDAQEKLESESGIPLSCRLGLIQTNLDPSRAKL